MLLTSISLMFEFLFPGQRPPLPKLLLPGGSYGHCMSRFLDLRILPEFSVFVPHILGKMVVDRTCLYKIEELFHEW